MVCGPALEFHLLAVLEADLAINHVRGGVVSRFAVTNPALRACIVPKLNFGLFGDEFHGFILSCVHGAKLGCRYMGLTQSLASRDVE